jgi:magnesium transporter
MMRNNEVILLVDTLRKLHRRGAKVNIVKILQKTHPADLAHLFRSFTKEERHDFFKLMPDNQLRGDLISELDDAIIISIFSELEDIEIVKILLEMDYDDENAVLRILPEDLRDRLLELMKDDESRELEALMEYPDDSAGSIMTPEVFHLQEDFTAEEAIEAIRKAVDSEMVFYIYVVDDRNHLLGVVSLRQLIIVAPRTRLRNIISEEVISVHPETDQEEVARIISRYDFLAIPVVDKENKLLGIVTVDDIIDVMREEATEDLLQMAGVGRDREIMLKSTWEASKIRFPWLFTTWVGGLIAAIVIGFFQDIISQFVLLASFLPIIAGMGGNVGTQSSTIITRGIATGRVNPERYWHIVFNELKIGLFLGLTYGLLLGVVSIFLYRATPFIGLTVAMAITFAMTLATFIGTYGPILLTRMKIDPAIATGPVVTTAIDIIGIAIYLIIATFLSQWIG